MCGIACIVNKKGAAGIGVLESFTHAVARRGPDGFGFATFAPTSDLAEGGGDHYAVGLGHRRLSILDLSPAGAQPMLSADRNLAITYNGEVYNYLEIGDELRSRGVALKSHCDTEVLLDAYAAWGPECLHQLNGMWAFVILDRRKHQLFVSRDRLGVKPLYYYQDEQVLAFASEIKQFFALPSFRKRMNPAACVSYLSTGYEAPPETFFEGVRAFPPGHRATVDLNNPEVKPERFWFPERIQARPLPAEEAKALVLGKFLDAVRLRLRSDVTVGGCLSGGLDSSSIFVAMKELSPTSTFAAFSSCFDAPGIDERPFMEKIVAQTASEHFQVFPDAADLAADFDALLLTHDEPIGSVSMYAQYQVMKAARRNNVTVLLDGQGGDELFSGYWPAYFLALNHHLRRGSWPFVARNLLGACCPWGNHNLVGQAFSHFQDYRNRAARTLPFQLRPELAAQLEELNWHHQAQRLTPQEYRRAEILKIHLPRLLKWEDRNSMAHSIESRVPFLDVNLVEAVLSLPPEQNLKSGWNKRLLREAMAGRLPDAIRWRKDKKGFETPQDAWMRQGPFHAKLLAWANSKKHPVAEFVSTDFDAIARSLQSGSFGTGPMFRLFCFDEWARLLF